jgi:hypothetical protein
MSWIFIEIFKTGRELNYAKLPWIHGFKPAFARVSNSHFHGREVDCLRISLRAFEIEINVRQGWLIAPRK